MDVTDQLGLSLSFKQPPRKIVSLVPSQTELLYALGLDEQVIAITSFCIHPSHWKKTKHIIGGTKKIHIEKILRLKPDLIIANKEENVREQVLHLAERFPVYTSDISNLESALQMIQAIGNITGTVTAAGSLSLNITNAFDQLSKKLLSRRKAAYLIWKNPYMTVGGDTFIHDIMQRGGFMNVFGSATRYPVIDVSNLKKAGCEVILCSTEPYPFKLQHLEELQQQLPGTRVVLADGEAFSWYGSRLTETPAYLDTLQKSI